MIRSLERISPRVLPVELRQIVFRYGEAPVLRGVDLELRAGEIVALLGPNGAGKTTVISLLLGLEQPERGVRSFAGRVAPEVTIDIRAAIAWVGHAPQLQERLSAMENLELSANLSAAAGARRVGPRELASWLEVFGLDPSLRRPVSTYSRGMAQRVALARAFSREPDLLVLDEPFTALDGNGRQRLGEQLRLAREQGRAVLFSSHDHETVLALADQVLWLNEGVVAHRVERSVGPEELRRVTARWIGVESV